MHPALSKSERKRYAGYDPDKWYPWTTELSAEFTDLMRRSPRDTSFARGFAYVSQRAIPEGHYVPTSSLLEHFDRLPGAYRGPDGSGFRATVDRPGHAIVRYSGLSGFANVCIAIQGEIVQRMQASGAHSVVVKHRPTCRLNGADVCEFEVEWSGESAPAEARPVRTQEIMMDYERQGGAEPPPASAPTPDAVAAAEPLAAASQGAYAPMEHSRSTVSSTTYSGGNGGGHTPMDLTSSTGAGADLASSEDLFIQLRKRLAEADRQARLYADAQQEIDRLRVELSRVRAQAEAEVAQADKEKNEALDTLADLKRRIRGIVGND